VTGAFLSSHVKEEDLEKEDKTYVPPASPDGATRSVTTPASTLGLKCMVA